jgi:hypothetical protein
MTYDPLALLDLCNSLCNGLPSVDGETVSRTIISRAYYCAFLYAREFLKLKRHVKFEGSGVDHGRVEWHLKKDVDRHLGSIIRTLRENRSAADYDLRNPAVANPQDRFHPRLLFFGRKEQQECIDLAKYITNNLAKKH